MLACLHELPTEPLQTVLETSTIECISDDVTRSDTLLVVVMSGTSSTSVSCMHHVGLGTVLRLCRNAP